MSDASPPKKEQKKSNNKNVSEVSDDHNSQGAIASSHHAQRYSPKDEPYFVIDKSVGLITVTAKPALMNVVEKYIDNLKSLLFQQINIEAKIVEVYFHDNSKIGIDWSSVFKDNKLFGSINFGNKSQVYPHVPGDLNYASTFIGRVELNSFNFNVLINALNEQGDTRVLANPRITVLNGQPAMISVGKDVAYIKSIKRDENDSTTGTRVAYTAEVGNVVQGIALGVIASVADKDKIVLHLTPITTDIENLQADGSIAMTSIGDRAMELGLPQVKIREMSTIVEVQNGEMLVIGGIIDSTESRNENFIPGLGNIPGIKYLFGVEEKKVIKRELVILLSPKII
jgi:general secretion pathway protein D/MSHA biogenesis protein MshL